MSQVKAKLAILAMIDKELAVMEPHTRGPWSSGRIRCAVDNVKRIRDQIATTQFDQDSDDEIWRNAEFPGDVGKAGRLGNHGCAWSSWYPGKICGKSEAGWINEKGETFQWAQVEKEKL